MEKILVHPPEGIPPRLLIDYRANCLEALAAAKNALARSDHETTRVFGHRLKGTGRAYGIPVLTEIGASIEDASTRDDDLQIQRQVAYLDEYLNHIEIAGA